MGEDGGGGSGGGGGGGGHGGGGGGAHGGAEPVVAHGASHGGAHAVNGDRDPPAPIKTEHRTNTSTVEDDYPISPRAATPNPFSRKNTSLDLDDYFVSLPDNVRHPRLWSGADLGFNRLDREISRNTRNGRCLCRCTVLSRQK